MSVIIGIDVGGSTTKIAGFRMDRTLIEPIFVHATDPVTSVYGAFGKFTSENGLKLSDISRVMIKGIGSSCISSSIFNLPCTHVSEFRAVGCGGRSPPTARSAGAAPRTGTLQGAKAAVPCIIRRRMVNNSIDLP